MNVNQKNKVTWLTYPAFEKFPGIVHGFSTRLGGVSQGIYESMNLSFTRGDEESAVRENYRRLSAAMGFSMEDIVTSDQTHTTNVRVVTEEDRGNGITKPRPYTDVDGMIT
ncbi:laccase domain-containing protein, partial [Blautia sp.]